MASWRKSTGIILGYILFLLGLYGQTFSRLLYEVFMKMMTPTLFEFLCASLFYFLLIAAISVVSKETR